MVVGGPPGALVGAAVTPGIEALVLAGRDRAVRRANEALQVAAGQLGLDEAALVNHGLSDDQRLRLTLETVQAASRTLWGAKVRLLGRVLADGLGDNTRLDDAGFLAATINDLEPPHVEVLAYVFQKVTQPGTVVRTSDIMAELPHLGEPTLAILATLSRHGLIGQPGGVWGTSDVEVNAGWAPTVFGRRVLDLLREAEN
jgi:hypothetical protein